MEQMKKSSEKRGTLPYYMGWGIAYGSLFGTSIGLVTKAPAIGYLAGAAFGAAAGAMFGRALLKNQ